ncbi:MAG TPA: rhomboid family intramembrane serine protease [Pirellulaceae bacterium]|nr:rhomboid family intramembrane serine protease [Pirellulaceae bacterium]
MLFPYASDAPVYHWPSTTVGLIVVNVAMFFLWGPYSVDEGELNSYFERQFAQQQSQPESDETTPPEDMLVEIPPEAFDLESVPNEFKYPDWRMLQFGNGLHPVQWLTANFMHGDILHLLSNMLFLWAMGLVIEGKLGWWRFLLVYLGIGTVGYGIVQVMMLGAAGGNALGASLPIFGLIVLAMLWAPVNSLQCVLLAGVSTRLVELPIYLFALIYLALQIFIFGISGMGMGSEALHLVGAFVALPVGVFMLHRKLVDCENYDAWSVWTGRHELTRDERREQEEASPEFQAKVANHREAMLAQLKALIEEQKNPVLAWAANERMTARFSDWLLPRDLFYQLIKQYHQQNLSQLAVPAMTAFVKAFPLEQTIDVRLKLAEMLIRDERPRQALQMLARLTPEQLNEKQRAAWATLQKQGERRRTEVDIEPAVEPW